MSGREAGPPPRADARRNRERVLEAAEEVFASDGLAVPVDEVARRAGVGPGTVYRHFPNKEALFQAIVTARVERLTDEARALVDADDPGAAFFVFLARMVEEGVAKRDLVDALTAAGHNVSAELGGVMGEYRAAVGQLLARAQAAGAVRADVGPADLMALVTATSVATRFHGAGPDVGDRLLAVVRDGLRAGAGHGGRA